MYKILDRVSSIIKNEEDEEGEEKVANAGVYLVKKGCKQ